MKTCALALEYGPHTAALDDDKTRVIHEHPQFIACRACPHILHGMAILLMQWIVCPIGADLAALI